MPARRRRTRQASGVDPVISLALAIVVALVVVCVLAAVTRGLILLVIPAGGLAWWWIHRTRRQRQQLTEAQEHAQWLQYSTHIGNLLALTPEQFENAVAHILRAVGFQDCAATKLTGDRGVDVIGRDPAGFLTAVQCKQYALHRKVSGPDVRNLIGARHQAGATHGMIVTTASFTREAVVAAGSAGITLIDGHHLTVMAAHAAATQPPT